MLDTPNAQLAAATAEVRGHEARRIGGAQAGLEDGGAREPQARPVEGPGAADQ
jgi:hypothetical protein